MIVQNYKKQQQAYQPLAESDFDIVNNTLIPFWHQKMVPFIP